jgi:hypothetical protein
MNRPYAQGDVLLWPVPSVPASAAEVVTGGVATLALGEATGHHHSIYDGRVRLFRETGSGDGVYLMVGDGAPVVLEHQEHRPVEVPPGSYQVRIQRTYRSGSVLRVED